MGRATGTILLTLVLSLASMTTAQRATFAKNRQSKGAKAMAKAFGMFRQGQFERSYRAARKISQRSLINFDYAQFVHAQSALLTGRYAEARKIFSLLAKDRDSYFRERASWAIADCQWQLGQYRDAQSLYRKLVAAAKKKSTADLGLGRYRIALAEHHLGRTARAVRELHEFRIRHPAHPMTAKAEAFVLEHGGEEAFRLSSKQRIERAENLKDAHLWHQAVAELRGIPDSDDSDITREHDYLLAMTLFKMRRRYKDASDILLRLYAQMGSRAAKALFHGARALSRADFDDEASRWYQRVVKEYPRSRWAAEAQFLSGWLEFNMGKYERALPHLARMRKDFGKSSWARSAIWFEGFSHFLLGNYSEALPLLEKVAARSAKLKGGKGRYWVARTKEHMKKKPEAIAEYRELVGRYPFSWYALLARERLRILGKKISPFGDDPRDPKRAPAIAHRIKRKFIRDKLIRRVDELIGAGLKIEAGRELRRGERSFLRRTPRAQALAIVMDRYHKAGNYNRPWMLAVVRGGSRALNAPPKGPARIWWKHAYPKAYRKLIEKWRHEGKNPPYYLYSIMRKESGFDPHVVSYANAMGLLQMIPATTRRVAKELGLKYTSDLLYKPELNIRTASWYVGRLLRKFRGQIPLGAGAFNGGPRPVMKWLDKNGDRQFDEFVELVSYRQTREYMKKVTETNARYLYLYDKKIYRQKLKVKKNYLVNKLTY